METWVLFLIVVTFCYCMFLYKLRRRRTRRNEFVVDENEDVVPIRGCRGWPVIGETLEFIASGYTSNPVSFMEKRKALYGDVFRTHILGKPIIVSTDPEVNKTILQNHGQLFVPCYPKSVTELFGKSSILQINGPLHKRVHALIGVFLKSPNFKAHITRDIEKIVKLSLSTWTENNNRRVHIQDETKTITFEILVRVLMSIGPGDEMEFLKKEFAEFIKGLICVPVNLPGTRLYKSLRAKKKMLKMVSKLVEERKTRVEKEETEEKTSPVDAIDILLRDTGESSSEEAARQKLSLDFITGNIIEMMIPGEETVPTTMTLAVKFLVDNPVALSYLSEENMELKKRKMESCEEYSWTDYMSLAFTQNVISETLRLANIINAIWRKSLEDVKIKGYVIPKGCCVLASLSSVHMDEANYENPYKFDPWRWKKIGNASSSITFTPFGGGQRLCPGLELSRLEVAIFLHHLVTTYRWVAEDDEIIYFPTVKMKRKLPVIVTPLPAMNCSQKKLV